MTAQTISYALSDQPLKEQWLEKVHTAHTVVFQMQMLQIMAKESDKALQHYTIQDYVALMDGLVARLEEVMSEFYGL